MVSKLFIGLVMLVAFSTVTVASGVQLNTELAAHYQAEQLYDSAVPGGDDDFAMGGSSIPKPVADCMAGCIDEIKHPKPRPPKPRLHQDFLDASYKLVELPGGRLVTVLDG